MGGRCGSNRPHPGSRRSAVLAQEEAILTWAMAAQADPPAPSTTVDRRRARCVAGRRRRRLGRRRSARAGRRPSWCRQDAHAHRRRPGSACARSGGVRGGADSEGSTDDGARHRHPGRHGRQAAPRMAPRRPATAARVPAAGRGHAGRRRGRHAHHARPPRASSRWPSATGGGSRWSAIRASCKVWAGAACSPSCARMAVSRNSNDCTGSPIAGKRRRRCNCEPGILGALDAYEAHGRIVAGTLDDHLHHIADSWIDPHQHGRTLAVVASTNDHVDLINRAVQFARFNAGHLDRSDGDTARRRRGRRSRRCRRDPAQRPSIDDERAVSRSATGTRGPSPPSTATGRSPCRIRRDTATSRLPADYVREHVRLGYAATEHGWQSDTVDTAIALTSPATSRRGLYVAATRGRDDNEICVVTDSDDVAEARDMLEAILAVDRADIPATTQRRTLAQTWPAPTPRRPRADAALRDPRLVPHRPRRRPTRPARRRSPRRRTGSTARPSNCSSGQRGRGARRRRRRHRRRPRRPASRRDPSRRSAPPP